MKPEERSIRSLVSIAASGALPWILLLLGIVAGGCRRDAGPATDTGIAGIYTLIAVDGATVPTRVAHGGAQVEIRAGSMALESDGTGTSRMLFVPPGGDEITREVRATYTRNGSRLDMRWAGAGTTTGAIEGDTFTMNNEGMVLVYRK